MNPSQNLAAEYSRKADAYARHWAPVIRPMALPLLAALPLRDARYVVDVGSGTGSLLPDLAAAAAPGAVIIGMDHSEGMLREGRRTSPHPVAVIDVQHLAIRSDVVDVALLAFVLFHMPDPARILAGLFRVLRKGGTLGIVTWGQDPGMPGASIWTDELDREGAAPDPRDQSVMRQGFLDTQEKLLTLLNAAGYLRLRLWSATFCHRWRLDDLLALQTGCGIPARRLADLTADARARCEARVRARLKALTPSDFTYQPEVLFAVAQRPV